MKITEPSSAGTTQRSDCMVMLEKGEGGIGLSLESRVLRQYGKQIERVVRKTLADLDVKDAKVTIVDEGALDWTIRARVQCAVYRSLHQTEGLPWGELS